MYEGLLVLSIVIYAAAIAIYLRHPAASIFHPATFYLAFHGLVFVIRPLFAWYYDFSEMYVAVGFSPTEWEKSRVLLCTNLGLVSFLTTVLWVAREPIRFRPDATDVRERAKLLATFWPIAVPLSLIGVYSLWWMIQFRATGQQLAVLDQFTGAGSLQASNGYFIGAGSVLGAISAMIAHLGRYRPWALLPFGMFALLILATGIRGNFVTVAVMIGLMFMFSRRLKWPTLRVMLGLLLVIPAFILVRDDRGASLREAFGIDIRYDIYANQNLVEHKPLETMDLANMEFFEYLVGIVPEKTGTYDYFLQNLQLVVAPIPRAIWTNKPVGAPIKMFELYRYGKALGATYSLPGMGWYYLGYLGVVIWSAVFALIYGTVHRLLARSRQSNMAVMAYCIFLPTSIVAFRDGTLMTIASQSLFFLAPVAALALLARFNIYADRQTFRIAGFPDQGETAGMAKSALLSPQARRKTAASREADLPAASVNPPAAPEIGSPRQRRLARMGGA